MPGYPIELELRDRTVLVVGLGAVGRRKAAGLARAGARVIGVDPDPDADLFRDGCHLLDEMGEVIPDLLRREHPAV